MKFAIVCDSAADLTNEYVEKAGITVVPFYVSMNGETYLKEGKDISVQKFYDEMVKNENCFPKTSMPSVQDYMEAFWPYVKENIPVLCICITKKFSGSMQSAMNAKLNLEEEVQGSKIEILDSNLVTALEGMLVKEAVKLRDHGLELEEAVKKLKEIRSTGHIFFTTKDLQYLQHGGRLGKVSCMAGTILNLKPLLHFYEGELGPTEVCRGRKKSLQKVTDSFFQYLKENHIDLSEYYFGTGIGYDIPEYDQFCDTLRNRFEEEGIEPGEWIKIRIGATIGVHTGPYPIGLGILKKCDI